MRSLRFIQAESLKTTYKDNGYIYDITSPELLVYRPDPEKDIHKAVIIVPGGSYNKNCITFEGYKTAEMLAKKGITSFILKYRIPNGNPQVVLEDGRQAVELVRSKAEEYGFNKLGIMGFSAGGHFVATQITKFETPEQKADFAVLVYPVTSIEYYNAGTGESLLGDKLEAQKQEWTLSNFVRKDMPSTTVIMCSDDKAVDVQQVMDFYNAAVEKKADIQLHFYPKGGHGFWMRDRFEYTSQVNNMLVAWIRSL